MVGRLWSLGVFYILIIALTVSSDGREDNARGRNQGCRFPSEWSGVWFQSTVRPYITIDQRSISSKGGCFMDKRHNKFIVRKGRGCFKCIVFHQKHRNVLQYKESFGCVTDYSRVDSLCRYIPGDANLYTMFRVDGESILCPFGTPETSGGVRRPYTFSYDRGRGECGWPQSEMEGCFNPTRLVFNYQACPNVPGSEMKSEEMECRASWSEGPFHYLVAKVNRLNRLLHPSAPASDEERFRCFVYSARAGNSSSADDIERLELAQSADATCNGLYSPKDGSKTIKLSKGQPKAGCQFPDWISGAKFGLGQEWKSLDGSLRLQFEQDGGVDRRVTHSSFETALWVNATVMTSGTGSIYSEVYDIVREESRLTCHSTVTPPGNNQRIILHQMKGCQSGYVCAELNRTGDASVFRLRLGSMSRTSGYACDASQFSGQSPMLLVSTARRGSDMEGHSRVTLGSRPGYYTLSSIAGGEGGSGGVPLLWQRGSGGSGGGGDRVGSDRGGGMSHQRVSAAVRDASQGRGNTPPTHSELNQEDVVISSHCIKDSPMESGDGSLKVEMRKFGLLSGCSESQDLIIQSSCHKQKKQKKGYVSFHHWHDGGSEYLIYRQVTSSLLSHHQPVDTLGRVMQEENSPVICLKTTSLQTMGSNSRISGDQFSLQLLDSHCNPTGNASEVDTIHMEYHGDCSSHSNQKATMNPLLIHSLICVVYPLSIGGVGIFRMKFSTSFPI